LHAVSHTGERTRPVYKPLTKHWNKRKKKYPLDPMLSKTNDLETSFIHDLSSTYVLKTGALCKSSGSSDGQRFSRSPEKVISLTASETIDLPRLSVNGLQHNTHTLTKSIQVGEAETTGQHADASYAFFDEPWSSRAGTKVITQHGMNLARPLT
jgi:hypothetical protein